MQFHVSVAKDHAVSEVKIDGATGKVIKVETIGDREHHEGEKYEG